MSYARYGLGRGAKSLSGHVRWEFNFFVRVVIIIVGIREITMFWSVYPHKHIEIEIFQCFMRLWIPICTYNYKGITSIEKKCRFTILVTVLTPFELRKMAEMSPFFTAIYVAIKFNRIHNMYIDFVCSLVKHLCVYIAGGFT